jgi:hypothetical protein
VIPAENTPCSEIFAEFFEITEFFRKKKEISEVLRLSRVVH